LSFQIAHAWRTVQTDTDAALTSSTVPSAIVSH
jgi:hypothetical protein